MKHNFYCGPSQCLRTTVGGAWRINILMNVTSMHFPETLYWNEHTGMCAPTVLITTPAFFHTENHYKISVPH